MTTENNKIIAEFMGLKPIEVFGSFSISKDHVSVNCKNIDDAMNSFCKSTKYHSDWNWLMEVVKECYNKEHHQNSHYEAIYYALADLNIEAVYNACLEFIKWYNENGAKEN